MSDQYTPEDEQAAIEAGHERSNPSGIPDEGMVHEHKGEVHILKKEPQPIPEEHHEEGHIPA